MGVLRAKAGGKIRFDGGQAPVVGEEVGLPEVEGFQAVEDGGVDEVAQAPAPVGFEDGDHVDLADGLRVGGFAPCACAGDRPAVTGGEEEVFGVEAEIVDELFAAGFNGPVPADVAFHDGAPGGFVARFVRAKAVAGGG